MIIVAAPGQGSQTPGFLTPWLEIDGVREHLELLSNASDVDLITHGTTSDADTIRATDIAQPLIVAASIVSGTVLLRGRSTETIGFAGHSVGEFAAAHFAGIVSDVDALRLVGVRGRAMAAEAATSATGMSAVIGGDSAELDYALATFGLVAANINGGGQVVVAGPLDALARLAESPVAGSRVIPLQVAGAFHTSFMSGAVETLRIAAESVPVANPHSVIYSNRDGHHVASGDTYRDLLVGQVESPVRWDLCMESFARDGVTGVIELAPGGALVGLVKRGVKGIPTVAIKTPDDLAPANELLEAS
jgi:[acyl-carrier-protein] S-malonyltransferase